MIVLIIHGVRAVLEDTHKFFQYSYRQLDEHTQRNVWWRPET